MKHVKVLVNALTGEVATSTLPGDEPPVLVVVLLCVHCAVDLQGKPCHIICLSGHLATPALLNPQP